MSREPVQPFEVREHALDRFGRPCEIAPEHRHEPPLSAYRLGETVDLRLERRTIAHRGTVDDEHGRSPRITGGPHGIHVAAQLASSGRSRNCARASGLASASVLRTARPLTTSVTASSLILPLRVRGMSATFAIRAGT